MIVTMRPSVMNGRNKCFLGGINCGVWQGGWVVVRLIKFQMNNQQSFGRMGESSAGIIAQSQKILNSVANLHLRTQTQELSEPRSPDPLQVDLRQTWRRPRMHYNKLPDAFQIRQKKKKSNKQLLDNLDRIVKINEYKEIQKLLDPIPHERKNELPPRHLPNGNPLATIHKYFKMESRFRQKLQEQGRSVQKYKAFSAKQPDCPIRITECLTLEVVKRGHNTGTIKKMLHVPSLKLVCVREEPLNTKEQRMGIKKWLELWQTKISSLSSHFLPLHGYLFNVPEGALSIITEYAPNGSLLNLLDSVFTLPESVIRQVFVSVVHGLHEFYKIADPQFCHFGGLSPSQVLFSSSGEVKLGMGMFYHLSATSSPSMYNLRLTPKPSPFELTSTQRHFMKQPGTPPAELDRTMDVFKIGLMTLECAIGGLEGFEQSPLLQEALRNAFTEDGQRTLERQNVCCLIHSEAYLLESVGQQDERSRRDRVDLSRVAPYSKFLKERFSIPFINFLCCSLKLVHSKRSTLQDLLSHTFLTNEGYKDTKTVQINLKDLLVINSGWNQQLLQSVREQQGQKLVSHILHVFNDMRREVAHDLVLNHKQKILHLGQYIGLNYAGLGQRLYEAMLALAKPKRDFNTSI